MATGEILRGKQATVGDHFEAQFVHVEAQACFQIVDENHDVLDAEVGFFATMAKHATVRPREGRVAGHRRDYNERPISLPPR